MEKLKWPSIEERRHQYYILTMKYKLLQGRYNEAQRKADTAWHHAREAYDELLNFTNKYGHYREVFNIKE